VSNVVPSPGSARAGKQAGVKLTLTNSGNSTASGTAAVTLSLSTASSGAGGQTVSPTPAPLKVRLPANRSRTFRVRFAVPSSLAAGGYYLSVSVNVASLGDATAADGNTVSTQTLIVR
jgi:hypothetical protein